jgi:hypothetical protein
VFADILNRFQKALFDFVVEKNILSDVSEEDLVLAEVLSLFFALSYIEPLFQFSLFLQILSLPNFLFNF